MKLKLVVDMNLSPSWVGLLKSHGIETVHWSDVGDPKATDKTIMDWATRNRHIVITHDLDFGAILAVTQAQGPSVIQIRAQNVLPEALGTIVSETIMKYESQLESGCLIVLDETTDRLRILPLFR